MVSFTYTKSNMPPRLDETFGSLSADWTVSNGIYAYASGGELVVKTQNSYSTYHRHWAKNAVLFGNLKARFKMTGWTNPVKPRLMSNVFMTPLPDDVRVDFWTENPNTPFVPGTLVVKSELNTYYEGVDYDIINTSTGQIRFRYPVPNTWVVKADWERFDYYCIYSWRFRAQSDTQCYALVFDFWRKKIRIIRFNGTDNAYETAYDLASVDMGAPMPGGGTRWVEVYVEEQQPSVYAIRAGIYTDSGYVTLETSIEAAISGSPSWIEKAYTKFSAEGKNPAYCEVHFDDYMVYESLTDRGAVITPNGMKKATISLVSSSIKAAKTTSGEIFSDNFISTKTQWTLQGATIGSGILSITPTGGSTVYALNSTNLTNFIFDGKFTVVTVGSGSSELDIRFRRVDNSNEYALSFLTNIGSFKLRKLVNGIWADIDSSPHVFSNGETLFWRVECTGDIIKVWIWSSIKSLLWSTTKQDQQYSSGNFRITGYDTGNFSIDKIAIYTSYKLYLSPALISMELKIYNQDMSTLIETITSPGGLGIDVYDIAKYEFPDLNLYIEVYNADMVYMYTITDLLNALGGDTHSFSASMIPLSIVANVYHVVIADLGGTGKIIGVPIIASMATYDFPKKGIVINSLGSTCVVGPDGLRRAAIGSQIRARTSFMEFSSIGKVLSQLIKADTPVSLWPCTHRDTEKCDTSAVAYVGSFVTY